MSFLELRCLSETLRAVGFPRLLSLESFRQPNFPLAAEVLRWLVSRLHPEAAVPIDLGSESGRLAFLSAALHAAQARTQVALRARALYAGDGRAARELLRLARVLLAAARAAEGPAPPPAPPFEAPPGQAAGRPSEVAAVRAQAAAVAARSRELGALLHAEPTAGAAREAAGALLESLVAEDEAGALRGGEAEGVRVLRGALALALDEAAALDERVGALRDDEDSIAADVQHREAELARSRRRLDSLAAIRPAFMDEHDRLELEMADEHSAYVTKARNLDFLLAQLRALRRAERASARAAVREMRALRKQLREDEFRAFRGDEELGEADLQEGGGPGPSEGDERGPRRTDTGQGSGKAREQWTGLERDGEF